MDGARGGGGFCDRHATAVAVFILASTGACLFVLFAVSGPFNGDDAYIHTLWAQQFLTSVHQGVLRPCWIDASNAGCGSPTLFFYPPMEFWAYLPLHGMVRSVPLLVQAALSMALVAAGLSMFAVARRVTAVGPALVAALLFMLSPYALTDVGYRCAAGEVWALVFLPWVLGGVLLGGAGARWRDPLWIAAGTTGLLLSHMPSSIIAVHLVPLAAVTRYLVDRDLVAAVGRLVALPIAVVAAGVFVVPLLAHWPHVEVESILRYDYAYNFLWSDRAVDLEINASLSGIAVLGAATCAMAGAVRYLTTRTVSGVAVVGLVCFAVMTPLAAPLWRVMPLLQVIGFPWRLLMVVSPCAALGVAMAAQDLREGGKGTPRFAFALGLVLVVLVNVMATVHVLSAVRCHDGRLDIVPGMAEEALKDEFDRLIPGTRSMRDMDEYRPRWSVGHEPGRPHDIVMPESFYHGERAILGTGEAVEVQHWEAELRRLRVAVARPTQLLVRTFYYPSWEATGDGASLTTSPHEQSGLLRVDIPAGVDVVELRFARDRWHAVGWSMSLAAALCAALGLVLRWRLRCAR